MVNVKEEPIAVAGMGWGMVASLVTVIEMSLPLLRTGTVKASWVTRTQGTTSPGWKFLVERVIDEVHTVLPNTGLPTTKNCCGERTNGGVPTTFLSWATTSTLVTPVGTV